MSLTIQPFKPDFFGMQKKTEQSYCVARFQVSESTALLVQVCVMSKGASQGTRRDISFLSWMPKPQGFGFASEALSMHLHQ